MKPTMPPPPSQTLGVESIDRDDGPLQLVFRSRHVQSEWPGVCGTRNLTDLALATHSSPKRAGATRTAPGATNLSRKASTFRASFATKVKVAKPNALPSKETSTISPKPPLAKQIPPPKPFTAQSARKQALKYVPNASAAGYLSMVRDAAVKDKLAAKTSKLKSSETVSAEDSKSNAREANLGHDGPIRSPPAPSAQKATLEKIAKKLSEEGATATAESTSSPNYDGEAVLNTVEPTETGETLKDPATVNNEPTIKPQSVTSNQSIPTSKPRKTPAEVAKVLKELNLSPYVKTRDTETAKPRKTRATETTKPRKTSDTETTKPRDSSTPVKVFDEITSQRLDQQLAGWRQEEVAAQNFADSLLRIAALNERAIEGKRREEEEHKAQCRESERATYQQWQALTNSPELGGERIQSSLESMSRFYKHRSSKLLDMRKQIADSYAASCEAVDEVNEPDILRQFILIQHTHASIKVLIDAVRAAFDAKVTFWEKWHRTQEAWQDDYMAVAHRLRIYTHLVKYYPKDRPELYNRRCHALILRRPFEQYWAAWEAILDQFCNGDASIGAKWERLKPLEGDIRKTYRRVMDAQAAIVRPNGWLERMDVWRAMKGSLIDQELLRTLRPFWVFRSRSSGFPRYLRNARELLIKAHPEEASRPQPFRVMFTKLEDLNSLPFDLPQAAQEVEFAVYDRVQERAKLGLLDGKSLKRWHVQRLMEMQLAATEVVLYKRSKGDEASHDQSFRIRRKPVGESTKSGNPPGDDVVTSDIRHEKPKSITDTAPGALDIRASSKLQRANLGTTLGYDCSASPTVCYDLHSRSCCNAGCGTPEMSTRGPVDHQVYSRTYVEQEGVTINGISKVAWSAGHASKVATRAIHTESSKLPLSTHPSTADGRPSDDGSHSYGSQGFNGEYQSSSPSDPCDESSSDELSENGSETVLKEVQVPLSYQIPQATLRAALLASCSGSVAYWSHAMYRGPNREKVTVHYCRSKETTDQVAKLFLDKDLLGFDIEWKPDSRDEHGIKNNVSLVQLACEDRIALFHIALHKGESKEQLLAPTLRTIMESPDITKAGVSIRADCTRLRKFLGIEAQGIFELSHLYRLVKFSTTNRRLVNKRLVSLAQQVEEHLQLPMNKGDVRESDWSKDLTYEQVMYAASDSYAAVHLFDVMERKRKKLDPTPPRPAHAELNLPISLAVVVVEDSTEDSPETQEGNGDETVGKSNDAVLQAVPHELSSRGGGFSRTTVSEEPSENPENEGDVVAQSDGEVDRSALTLEILADTLGDLSVSDIREPPTLAAKESLAVSPLDAAQSWASDYLSSRDPPHNSLRPRASAANLRAYYLWHHQHLDLAQIAAHLRDPPLALSTVALYTLDAIRLEDLAYDKDRVRSELFGHVRESVIKTRYRKLLEEIQEY